ncbi:Sister chromatid cohesion protein 2 [Pseudogymnoascus australis]
MKEPKSNGVLDFQSLLVDSGYNGDDKKAAAVMLYCSLREAFNIENEIADTTNEFQAIDIDRIGDLHFVLSNIKQHLRKVLALGSLSHLPLEYILRLQKLCESCLNAAQITELKLEDKQEMEQHALISDCGLLSGHILLLIRSGGHPEMQSCFGNVFQTVSNALRNVLETCIIPTNQLQVSAATEPFAALISTCEQTLELLATLGGVIMFPTTVLDALESTAFLLLFADNGEGKTRLKKLRTTAIDLLVQVFLYYPSQRSSIVNEIIISLNQTKGFQGSRDIKLLKGEVFNEGNTSSASELALEADRSKALRTEVKQRSSKNTKKGKPTPPEALSALVSPLLETATNIATQITDFVIGRAISSSKIREESFRNLLCIFVEDFARSFDCPEWPAAELLLRLILFRMIRLLEADETTSTVKLMAVDVLGLIGTAISGLNFNIRHTTISEKSKTNFSWYPKNIMGGPLQFKPRLEDITSLGGAFHASVAFLTLRSAPQIHGAVGYLTAQWAFSTYDSTGIDTDPKNNTQERSLLVAKLQMMIAEKAYEPKAFDPHCVSASSARLAYGLILLRSRFCESFSRVLETVLDSARSLHAPTRCRSLKVLLQIMEADPLLISHTPAIQASISGRTKDISVSVRLSSLRCIELTPNLGVELMPDVLRCITDESVAVRKRAMKILEDIYLQNPETNAKNGITEILLSQIAKALLYRTVDLDLIIQGLACQIIEKIWISPHTPASTKKTSSKTTVAMTSHLCLMAKIVQGDRRLSPILIAALQVICLHPSRGSAALRVCSLFVATMFSMIDKSTARGNTSVDAAATFQLLLILAKTNANIFTAQQIPLLQPYVINISTRDDIMVYRCVISILHCSLPLVSDVDPEFLRSTGRVLIKQITRFKRAILNEVIPCLWAIGEKLEDNKPLTNLALSCLEHIQSMVDLRFHGPINQEAVRKVKKLLLIAGICGRHCHFEAGPFQMKFRDCHSVSKFMFDTFLLFSSLEQPMELREAALDAICRICQVQPKYFTSSVVTTLFEQAFEEENSLLESVILQAFKEFLIAAEQSSKASSRVIANLNHIGDSDSQIDGVAKFITEKYMSGRKDLMRIALATQDDQALLAIEVLFSMIRQGLLHPKECAQICIALETSENVKIAEKSFVMHRTLHQKFESDIERGYSEAVYLTYQYQLNVIGNVRGATCEPYRSILHRMMEVTKTGRIMGRKKFLEGLCAQIEPDLSQRSCIDLEQYLQRSRFILENMAYFKYASAKELDATITAMEKVFTRAGTVVADLIETEILVLTTPIETRKDSFDRLRTLAAFSTALSGLWHAMSYLRQQYSLLSGCTSTANETSSKELSKAPSKLTDINGRALWERNSMMMTTLDSEKTMLTMCRAFIELSQEVIGSKVGALSGSDFPEEVPRSTGAREA